MPTSNKKATKTRGPGFTVEKETGANPWKVKDSDGNVISQHRSSTAAQNRANAEAAKVIESAGGKNPAPRLTPSDEGKISAKEKRARVGRQHRFAEKQQAADIAAAEKAADEAPLSAKTLPAEKQGSAVQRLPRERRQTLAEARAKRAAEFQAEPIKTDEELIREKDLTERGKAQRSDIAKAAERESRVADVRRDLMETNPEMTVTEAQNRAPGTYSQAVRNWDLAADQLPKEVKGGFDPTGPVQEPVGSAREQLQAGPETIARRMARGEGTGLPVDLPVIDAYATKGGKPTQAWEKWLSQAGNPDHRTRVPKNLQQSLAYELHTGHEPYWGTEGSKMVTDAHRTTHNRLMSEARDIVKSGGAPDEITAINNMADTEGWRNYQRITRLPGVGPGDASHLNLGEALTQEPLPAGRAAQPVLGDPTRPPSRPLNLTPAGPESAIPLDEVAPLVAEAPGTPIGGGGPTRPPTRPLPKPTGIPEPTPTFPGQVFDKPKSLSSLTGTPGRAATTFGEEVMSPGLGGSMRGGRFGGTNPFIQSGGLFDDALAAEAKTSFPGQVFGKAAATPAAAEAPWARPAGAPAADFGESVLGGAAKAPATSGGGLNLSPYTLDVEEAFGANALKTAAARAPGTFGLSSLKGIRNVPYNPELAGLGNWFTREGAANLVSKGGPVRGALGPAIAGYAAGTGASMLANKIEGPTGSPGSTRQDIGQGLRGFGAIAPVAAGAAPMIAAALPEAVAASGPIGWGIAGTLAAGYGLGNALFASDRTEEDDLRDWLEKQDLDTQDFSTAVTKYQDLVESNTPRKEALRTVQDAVDQAKAQLEMEKAAAAQQQTQSPRFTVTPQMTMALQQMALDDVDKQIADYSRFAGLSTAATNEATTGMGANQAALYRHAGTEQDKAMIAYLNAQKAQIPYMPIKKSIDSELALQEQIRQRLEQMDLAKAFPEQGASSSSSSSTPDAATLAMLAEFQKTQNSLTSAR
jgi:hypothetical protein